jgi:hypothetical protein
VIFFFFSLEKIGGFGVSIPRRFVLVSPIGSSIPFFGLLFSLFPLAHTKISLRQGNS